MDIPDVQTALTRARQLKAVEHQFDVAGGKLVEAMTSKDPKLSDLLTKEWKKLLEQAEKELAAFYKRYPKCLSRRVNPWVR